MCETVAIQRFGIISSYKTNKYNLINPSLQPGNNTLSEKSHGFFYGPQCYTTLLFIRDRRQGPYLEKTPREWQHHHSFGSRCEAWGRKQGLTVRLRLRLTQVVVFTKVFRAACDRQTSPRPTGQTVYARRPQLTGYNKSALRANHGSGKKI